MGKRIEWEEIACVVRSSCHDATWIAHIQDADFDTTPAGPLRVVKAAAIDEIQSWQVEPMRYRWRHEDDQWVLDWAPAGD